MPSAYTPEPRLFGYSKRITWLTADQAMDRLPLDRDDAEAVHKIRLEAAKFQNAWCCDLRNDLSEQRVMFSAYASRTGQSPTRLDRILHGAAVLRVEDIAAFELFKRNEL